MYEKLADLLLYGRLEGDGAVLTELGDLWRDRETIQELLLIETENKRKRIFWFEFPVL